MRFCGRWRRNVFYYLRCGAKIATFMFWAALYLMVMKLTVFKSSGNTPVVKDWSSLPDNYTKWLLQGPVEGEDYQEVEPGFGDADTDNVTIADLEKRAELVRQTCEKRHLQSTHINNKEFFVDHVHNLVWCNIFKAASSFWMYKFNILSGYDTKFLASSRFTPLVLARKKYPRPSEEELRDAIANPGIISLLVVREPFVRLLSAYRDKLEKVGAPYYRKLAISIIARYREKTDKIGPPKSFGPTFYEFVSHLIATKDHMDEYDEHWAPYYKFCTPCAANFTVVAKVETLARDSSYVIRQLGLGHVLRRGMKDRRMRLRIVVNKSKDGKNTTALLKYYFKQLDERMLDNLLDIYGIDFEMFGYDPKIYRSYVRK